MEREDCSGIGRSYSAGWIKQNPVHPLRVKLGVIPSLSVAGGAVCPAAGKWVPCTQHECRKPEVFSTKKGVGGSASRDRRHSGPCHEPKVGQARHPASNPPRPPGRTGPREEQLADCRRASSGAYRIPVGATVHCRAAGRPKTPSAGQQRAGYPGGPGGGRPEASLEGGPDLGPSGRQAAA